MPPHPNFAPSIPTDTMHRRSDRIIYPPDQVLASNSRRLHGGTHETRSGEPNAPGRAHHGKAEAEGDAEVSVPIRGHVGKDFRPSLVAVGGLARIGRHGGGGGGRSWLFWVVRARLRGLHRCAPAGFLRWKHTRFLV